jgi:hypothetical protein
MRSELIMSDEAIIKLDQPTIINQFLIARLTKRLIPNGIIDKTTIGKDINRKNSIFVNIVLVLSQKKIPE